MATTRTNEISQAIIRVNEGTTENVAAKNRTFNHIAPTATDDNVRTFFERMGQLQTLPVLGIQRVDKCTLAAE